MGSFNRLLISLLLCASIATAEDTAPPAPADSGAGQRSWTWEQLQPVLRRARTLGPSTPVSFKFGKQLYVQAQCVTCHRLDGQGQEFGPDLAQLGAQWTPEKILRQIVEPSAEINPNFRSQQFELQSGETVTGLLVAAGRDHVRVIENPLKSRQPRKLFLREIVQRSRSSQSLMPSGLLDGLDEEQVLNLLAYVYARGNSQDAIYRQR